MGKNKKREIQVPKMPPQKRTELNSLTEKLLNKCTDLPDAKYLWRDYEEIYNLIQEIRAVEQDYNVQFPKRDEHWESFLSWCSENGAYYKSIDIMKMKDGDYGVIAKESLNEGDLIFKVPRKLAMISKGAGESSLGAFIRKDPILQHMENVALAFHIMNEYVNQDSFWKPYLSILPSEYNTLLYFTNEELKELTGSVALEECIKLYKSISRQYAYFYKQFQVCPELRSSPLRHYFTYDFYRWAVSTVMTRQNMLPSEDGSNSSYALVPLWDMCNHASGKISTDYNIQGNCLECVAMKNFSKGDEVSIFYGPRSNLEFFLHNGFVYAENQNDSIPLKLGISKSDPLFPLKSKLCSKLNMPITATFLLHTGDNPVDKKLLTFLKVLVMKEDKLKEYVEAGKDSKLISDGKFERDSLTQDSLNYISTRATLLLRMYPTDIEKDVSLLKTELTPKLWMAVQLRLGEKHILQSICKYAANYSKEIH